MKKIYICVGTRADIIKMSEIIKELKNNDTISVWVCASGQHRELANLVLSELGISINESFDIMMPEQTPSYILSSALSKYSESMRKYQPDLVLVHGDTATATAGALAAFYLHIPVFHVEAGLRTYASIPFPEEMHRRVITCCSTIFACPDSQSMQNLIAERVDATKIFVTGNPITDVIYNSVKNTYQFKCSILNGFNFDVAKEVVVTMHRNELSVNELINVCNSIKNVADSCKDVTFFWPVHPNPRIHDTVYRILEKCKNVLLLDSLSVRDMHNLLFRCALVLTDSAGIQEEAFLLDKPCIILRERTERPEFVDAFKSKLLAPADHYITEEILKALENAPYKSDMTVNSRLFAMTGVSKKIATIASNAVNAI